MRFIVEVPTYIKVEVDAVDARLAALAAESVAAAYGGTLLDPEGARSHLSAELHLLAPEEEDREPDVYVCRGGKLTAVDAEGWLEPLDEEC